MALLLPFLLVQFDHPFAILGLAVAISLVATVAEALSPLGSDNFFVPLIILIFLYLLF